MGVRIVAGLIAHRHNVRPLTRGRRFAVGEIPAPADQARKGLLDRNVAQRQTTRVNEHRISFEMGPAPRQTAMAGL